MAFSAHDVVPDSPTNTFATFNPLETTTGTVGNGNLIVTTGTTTQNISTTTLAVNSGYWYWEVYMSGISGTGTNNQFVVGVTTPESDKINYLGSNYGDIAYFGFSGKKNKDGTGWVTYGATYGTSTIISVAINLDSGTIEFFKNNVSQGIAYTGLTGTYLPAISDGSTGVNVSMIINFGQDPTFNGAKSPTTTYTDANGIGSFFYQPPTGALALCTANLPDPTIDPAEDDVPEDYMKTVLYTGNGSTQSITGVGFQPDFTWIKMRSSDTTGRSPIITDSVRQASYSLLSDNNGAEVYDTNDLSAFISDGFSVGSNARVNGASKAMVAWNWKAGGAPSGSTTTIGSAKRINTSGTQDDTSCSALASAASATITPTLMSINQKAGFSIVKYTGTQTASQTVPHGLTQRPDFVITKALGGTVNWGVWHSNLSGNSSYLGLNQTIDEYSDTTVFYNFTDTIIGIGSDNRANSTNGVIAYCWHSVAGYSKFGSYVGTSTTDGTFVYCGFKPAWVMIKAATEQTTANQSYASWFIADSARSLYNPSGGNNVLWANKSINEGYRGDGTTANASVYLDIDFLSNGFKLRNGAVVETNRSDTTYIYAAFAEQPFKYANAR